MIRVRNQTKLQEVKSCTKAITLDLVRIRQKYIRTSCQRQKPFVKKGRKIETLIALIAFSINIISKADSLSIFSRLFFNFSLLKSNLITNSKDIKKKKHSPLTDYNLISNHIPKNRGPFIHPVNKFKFSLSHNRQKVHVEEFCKERFVR